MKKVIIAGTLAVSIVLITACSGGYTCPTYMKLDQKQLKKTEDSERV